MIWLVIPLALFNVFVMYFYARLCENTGEIAMHIKVLRLVGKEIDDFQKLSEEQKKESRVILNLLQGLVDLEAEPVLPRWLRRSKKQTDSHAIS